MANKTKYSRQRPSKSGASKAQLRALQARIDRIVIRLRRLEKDIMELSTYLAPAIVLSKGRQP